MNKLIKSLYQYNRIQSKCTNLICGKLLSIGDGGGSRGGTAGGTIKIFYWIDIIKSEIEEKFIFNILCFVGDSGTLTLGGVGGVLGRSEDVSDWKKYDHN